MKREYYRNGQIEYEIRYKGEILHGLSRGWYSNGHPCYETPYHDGQIHGVEKSWDNRGNLEYADHYLRDRKVTREEYEASL